jgi:hypothetical protein
MALADPDLEPLWPEIQKLAVSSKTPSEPAQGSFD